MGGIEVGGCVGKCVYVVGCEYDGVGEVCVGVFWGDLFDVVFCVLDVGGEE